jgi:hypothetical protein
MLALIITFDSPTLWRQGSEPDKTLIGNLLTTALSHSGRGISEQPRVVDGTERLVAAASPADYPVVVNATRTLAVILAGRRAEAGLLIDLTVVLVIAIGGMGAAMEVPRAEDPD